MGEAPLQAESGAEGAGGLRRTPSVGSPGSKGGAPPSLETRRTKPGTRNPEHGTRNEKHEARNPRFKPRSLKYEIRNLKPEVRGYSPKVGFPVETFTNGQQGRFIAETRNRERESFFITSTEEKYPHKAVPEQNSKPATLKA